MRKDAVTPQLRQKILKRDRICFLARLSPTHICHDQWGEWHPRNDVSKLTLDHVHDGGGTMGKRAPSDEQHLVAMCAGGNIGGPSKEVRAREREYLRRLYE